MLNEENKANAEETETKQELPQEEKAQEEAAQETPEAEKDTSSAQQDQEPTPAQWREALEKAVKQRDEYLAMAQRAQADYQNFKRRNQQTRTEAYDDGVRETVAALLPALDNLERAIAAVGEENETLLTGVMMTHRQMLEAMTRMGLEEIPALGEKFNPDLHHAVMKSTEGEPGTVLEVFEKGYRVKGRIIRYAMVKIAVEE